MKNLFAMNKIIIFKVYKNVDVARKNELNDCMTVVVVVVALERWFQRHICTMLQCTYGPISHAQRYSSSIYTDDT